MPACGACGLRGRRARGGNLWKKAPRAWRCRDEEGCAERVAAAKLQARLTREPELDRSKVVWGGGRWVSDGAGVYFWQRLP